MANIGDRYVHRTAKGVILSELKVVKVTEKSMFLKNSLGKVYRKANSDKKYITIKPFSDGNFEIEISYIKED